MPKFVLVQRRTSWLELGFGHCGDFGQLVMTKVSANVGDKRAAEQIAGRLTELLRAEAAAA